jgi:hypothetical protein
MAKAKKADETPKKKVGDIHEAYGSKYEVIQIMDDGSVIVRMVE